MTEDGQKWLVEAWDRQDVADRIFLIRCGWTQDEEFWVKGDLRKKSRSSEFNNSAVHYQINEFISKDNWRILVVETYLPACKGIKGPQELTYYQSQNTGRIYQYLEIVSLYYNEGATEDDLFPARCSAKTVELNALFPGEKPDIIKVVFTSKNGYQLEVA